MVEAVDQLEGPNPTKPGNEKERVVCPTYGEIFKEAGHKIVIHAFTTQQSAPKTEEVAEKEDVVTQEPTSLNILAKITTNSGTEEPRDEVNPDFMNEDCTVTPDSYHETEIIEVEPQQQGNDGVEQGAITQEPTSLNVLVQVAVQMREEEPGIENILEFNEEICTMTPELSHDVDILEMESQQGDEEVN